MDPKIIFFDIDGTILSGRTGRIEATTIAAIKKAQENGHLAFINTGRTMTEIDREVKAIGFDGYVCGCGTYISYQERVLMHTAISEDLCKDILKYLRNENLEGVLEGSDAVYYNERTTLPQLCKQRAYQKDIQGSNILGWDSPELSFDKFCIWPTSKESYLRFYVKYMERFDFIGREGIFYEVIPKGYSKALGIAYLLGYLNIPLENTYALGDGSNDLAMLHYVKHSIAMGNSEAKIKDMASFVTKDVDSDGVTHALMHFQLI